MSGRAILFLVLGFSVIYLILGLNFGRLSTDSVKNYVTYYSSTNAHNIAVSGANLAANQIFFDPTWTTGYTNENYNGGTMNVSVQVLDAFKNVRQIVSTGTYQGYTSTVKVTLQPSSFSKFAYYSVYENGIWWVTGDTVFGPFHTQDYLRVAGHPVYNGKVTILKSIIRYNHQSSPILNGGFQQGVNLPLPTNGVATLENVANSGGHTFTGHDTVYITFVKDSIRYRFAYNAPETTVLTSSFAPNGTIVADNANLRIKGTIEGQLTVGASGSNGYGNVYIDDNVVYNSDPRTNPNSTDLLGIVAKNNVLVTDNVPNHNDVIIDGAIYAESGGFGAQNYSTRPISGTIYLLGGITQNSRAAVGTFNSYGLASGFYKNYRYDNRLMLSSPPYFPNTGAFEIVSWYE